MAGDKPHVAAAKKQIFAKFPAVKIIGGYRPGSITPGSDHPKGLALDVMVPVNSKLGDDIAAWTIANASALGVTYVIWKQRIWNVQKGDTAWRGMADRGSITRNHFDHVHISFSPNPGSGVTSAPTPSGLPGISNPFEPLNNVFSWMTNSDNWFRILYALAGLALVIFAMARLSGTTKAIRKVVA